MADVNLGLGEWEGAGGGLRGHMECSLDVFDVAGAERFTSSFKVCVYSAARFQNWHFQRLCFKRPKKCLAWQCLCLSL